jgi:FKBP-type peptidyl-prolyl cis-trans isomerase FkpA
MKTIAAVGLCLGVFLSSCGEGPSNEVGAMEITESGLKYEVLELGEGAKPTLADTVTVHYRGELLDGTVFDSSYDRGQPTSFPLGGVVAGWKEGLQLMPLGSKYRFEIPPDLGYGARAAGPIPPNSTLIFYVELLGIQ